MNRTLVYGSAVALAAGVAGLVWWRKRQGDPSVPGTPAAAAAEQLKGSALVAKGAALAPGNIPAAQAASNVATNAARALEGKPPARTQRPVVPTTETGGHFETVANTGSNVGVPGGRPPTSQVWVDDLSGQTPDGTGQQVSPKGELPPGTITFANTTTRATQAAEIGATFGPWGAAGAFVSTYIQDGAQAGITAIAGKDAGASVAEVWNNFDPTHSEGVAGQVYGAIGGLFKK